MRLIVEYSKGTWEFSVEGDGDYVDNFEVTSLAEAQAAAGDLVKEIAVNDVDEDPFDDLFKED